MEAKMTVLPYSLTTKRYTKVGKLMHVDLWGKYEKASIYRNYYYLFLVDDTSHTACKSGFSCWKKSEESLDMC